MRTLLALAVSYPSCEPAKAFEDARARLIGQWEAMLSIEQDPVIEAAKSHLQNGDKTGEKCRHRFISSYLLAWFVRSFMRDGRLHERLTADANLQLAGDGYTYGLDVGDFPSAPVRSPIMFLLDCMNQEDRISRDDLERVSLWQLLVLIG